MSTRKEIHKAIETACSAILPDVKWTSRLVGAGKGKGPQGSISCDRIDLINKSKQITHASAKYEIYIIDLAGTFDVDSAADKIVNTLNKTDMGGLCIMSNVTGIIYGSAQGFNDSNVCLVTLEVEFEYEITKGE